MGKQKKHKADHVKPRETSYDRQDDQSLRRDIGDEVESNVFNEDTGNTDHSQNSNDDSSHTRAKGMDA